MGRSNRRYLPRRLRLAIGTRTRLIRPILALLAVLLVALVPYAIRRLQEAPKVEPPFESIVGDADGPDRDEELTASQRQFRLSAAARNETVTFTKDVAPILWKNCGQCHRPGQVRPSRF